MPSFSNINRGIVMQMPQIRMQSQMAQIQINQTDATLQIRQPQAELSIQQPPAEVSINKTPARLQIDQTKAWEDMNLMHIFKLNEKFADEGKSAALDGIARRMQQARQLMEIENGGNPLSQQARVNSQDGIKRPAIEFIPSSFAVQTTYEPAQLEINVERNQPIIEANPQQPEFNYEPGSVKTSLKQRQDLEIRFINLFI